MAARRKDPIKAAHADVEKATKKLDALNDQFRNDGRKALEDDDQEKYDSLTEKYMEEESKLRREVELAYGRLGDAQRGDVTAEAKSESATEKAVEEERDPESDEEPVNPATDEREPA
jgi:hypothetical protein